MENILVTGANGLLGSHLVPYLKKCGHCVISHSRKTKADAVFDLSNRRLTFEYLDQIQPSTIINLAGLTDVDLCQHQVRSAYLANTRIVENLSQWMKKTHSRCHLIHISTDHVYDGLGLNKEDETVITNNYAFSKYAGELAALHVPSTILRTNFFGRSKSNTRLSFTDWLYNSLSSGTNMKVFNDVFFTPLSIGVLVSMIESLLTHKLIGVFNLGSNSGMSKADFAFEFARMLDLPTSLMIPIPVAQVDFIKVYRPRNMQMDCSKIENALGVRLPKLVDLINNIHCEYENFTGSNS